MLSRLDVPEGIFESEKYLLRQSIENYEKYISHRAFQKYFRI